MRCGLGLCTVGMEGGVWPEGRAGFEVYLNARSDAGSAETVAQSDRALQAGHDLASDAGDDDAAATWQRLLGTRIATRNLN